MGSSRVRTLAVLLLLAPAASVSDSRAAWLPGGTPICTFPEKQVEVDAAPDGAGGAFVAWSDRRDGGWVIYAQRMTDQGAPAPAWTPNGIPVFPLPPGAGNPVSSVIADGLGGCYVVTQYAGNFAVVRLLPDGTLAWTRGAIAEPYANWNWVASAVAGEAGSLFVQYARQVEWCLPDHCLPPENFWITQKIAATGEDLWIDRMLVEHHEQAQLVHDEVGGVWSLTTSYQQMVLRHLSPDGTMTPSSAFPSVPALVEFQAVPTGEGGLLICGVVPCDGADLRVQRVAASGDVAPGWPLEGIALCVAPGNQFFPAVVPDGAGGGVLAWTDWRRGEYVDDFRALRIQASSALGPGWPSDGLLIVDEPGSRRFARSGVVPDGTGGILAAWKDGRNTPNEVYAVHVTGGGDFAPGSAADGVLVATTVDRDQYSAPLVTDGAGGAYIFWCDTRDSMTTGQDVYGTRLAADQAVPVTSGPVEVVSGPGFVRIRWWILGAEGAHATVQRRSEPEEWRDHGRIPAAGSTYVDFEDRIEPTGGRFGYRLRFTNRADSEPVGEVWADVPPTPDTGLRRATAASRGLRIEFGLASDGPVSLSVHDVAGRTIDRMTWQSLDGGEHRVHVAGDRALPAGLYVVLLTAGSHRSQLKVTVFR